MCVRVCVHICAHACLSYSDWLVANFHTFLGETLKIFEFLKRSKVLKIFSLWFHNHSKSTLHTYCTICLVVKELRRQVWVFCISSDVRFFFLVFIRIPVS